MAAFTETVKKNIDRLELYVPVVARVHGGTHPEFKEVQKLFNGINAKIKAATYEKPELDNEFKQLREVTDNYNVPDDVCESYEAVYNMLAELDQAYQSQI